MVEGVVLVENKAANKFLNLNFLFLVEFFVISFEIDQICWGGSDWQHSSFVQGSPDGLVV